MEMSDRLYQAIKEVAEMKEPSVAMLLRKRGFKYEADRVERLVDAFEELDNEHRQNMGDAQS